MRGCTGLFLFVFLSVSAFSQTPGSGPADSGTGETPLSAMRNYLLGRDLEARNRMAEAETYYNEAIRLCQNEVSRNAATRDTYTVITWALQRQRKYADVITWGERGLHLYPDEYRIIEIMGEAHFYLNDYDRSLSFMQRYVNALPRGERVSVAYFFIGEIFRLRQQYLHADIAYTTAVRLEPGLALWWYRLATVRESAGDKSPAIEAYERALRLNPNYQEASAGLARIRAQ
ncbi:MAG: tetratricopeptide repeat protein [Treponema sp.]|nr:tetratricopeptide repeat protein [Treponema sp.]